MENVIRRARREDADGISRVIIAALRKTSARDYSEAVITRIEQSFSSAAVLAFMEHRLVFVAVSGANITGTASLDGHVVRTVFVQPQFQGCGIGRALMGHVELAAIEQGVSVLTVPSSVTAEPFYARLGFRSLRDSYYGEERTIIMERLVSSPSQHQ